MHVCEGALRLFGQIEMDRRVYVRVHVCPCLHVSVCTVYVFVGALWLFDQIEIDRFVCLCDCQHECTMVIQTARQLMDGFVAWPADLYISQVRVKCCILFSVNAVL